MKIKNKQVTFYLPPKIYERLKNLAEGDRRAVSNIGVKLIEMAIDEIDRVQEPTIRSFPRV